MRPSIELTGAVCHGLADLLEDVLRRRRARDVRVALLPPLAVDGRVIRRWHGVHAPALGRAELGVLGALGGHVPAEDVLGHGVAVPLQVGEMEEW